MSKVIVKKNAAGRGRRRKRVRKKVSGTPERPRLSVFRANRNMTCQLVDDERGATIASASTLEPAVKGAGKATKTEMARLLGEVIAKRGQERGVTTVVFDRGGYKYHGRVKALAETARENGLIF